MKRLIDESGSPVKVCISDHDGNVFSILATCRTAALDAGIPPDQVSAFLHEAMTNDYAHLLRVIADRFDIK